MTEQLGRLWAASPNMIRVLAILREVAATDTTVLITGETGTGKELAAEAIYSNSRRKKLAYGVVDCAGVAKELIEGELFGHVRGAFTGAESSRAGAFEAADRGTVFIDEIGELPLELQSRLLRVLENKQIRRVGSTEWRDIDVRVIAATHRDLEAEVRRGSFREDLYFRLNVVRVRIPPLRERPEDVLLLARQFLAEATQGRKSPLSIPPEAEKALVAADWPGNARQLRNVIESAAALSDKALRLNVALEPARPPGPAPEPSSAPAVPAGSLTEPLWKGKRFKSARAAVLQDFERGFLVALLEQHQGNVSKAARAAGVHRNILHRMIAKHRLKSSIHR
ncbi:MAG: sigma-54 dependent transcriptional regulator [Myxococcota bacterium]